MSEQIIKDRGVEALKTAAGPPARGKTPTPTAARTDPVPGRPSLS